jgi:hypothetical protein
VVPHPRIPLQPGIEILLDSILSEQSKENNITADDQNSLKSPDELDIYTVT